MTTTDLKRVFKQRVRHWAEKLDVKIVWLGIRPMRNKWASCSTNGHLNFNSKLLDLDDELWDYVIAHELLHFFVPNHGKLWKSLMKVHLGDYERLEGLFKGHQARKKPTIEDPEKFLIFISYPYHNVANHSVLTKMKGARRIYQDVPEPRIPAREVAPPVARREHHRARNSQS